MFPSRGFLQPVGTLPAGHLQVTRLHLLLQGEGRHGDIVFISSCQIFGMICVFGLYHGLILLPVVLCLLGPADDQEEEKQVARQTGWGETGVKTTKRRKSMWE